MTNKNSYQNISFSSFVTFSSHLALVACIAFFSIPSAFAAREIVIEKTYDELLQELKTTERMRVTQQSSRSWLNEKVHFGFGLVQSFSQFQGQGSTKNKSQNGIEILGGIHLSKTWLAEASWKNFGLSRSGTEEHSMRELSTRLGSEKFLNDKSKLHFKFGLAFRDLSVEDNVNGLSINENRTHFLVGGGYGYFIHTNLSAEIDLTARSPWRDDSQDRGSLDTTMSLVLAL